MPPAQRRAVTCELNDLLQDLLGRATVMRAAISRNAYSESARRARSLRERIEFLPRAVELLDEARVGHRARGVLRQRPDEGDWAGSNASSGGERAERAEHLAAVMEGHDDHRGDPEVPDDAVGPGRVPELVVADVVGRDDGARRATAYRTSRPPAQARARGPFAGARARCRRRARSEVPTGGVHQIDHRAVSSKEAGGLLDAAVSRLCIGPSPPSGSRERRARGVVIGR